MDKQIVVVTGASAGIGRATAIEFARHGWRVALLARGRDGLEGARRDVERAGGEAMTIVADVAEHEQMEAAAERIEQEWGPIDVWVNNAMATVFCEAQSIDPQDFRRATDVTYHGTVWGTLAALKRMKPRNRGTIVQVGSALAYRSIPLQAAYCGAKSAIRGFTDSLRSELIHDNSSVHLTMVQLAAFNTPQFDLGRTCMEEAPKPMGKIFQPEVAAQGIYWAATHRRREFWVGWPAAKAIIGTKFIPGLLDRMLARQAVKGQKAQKPRDPARPDNLYEPVPGDHGAHGRFDDQAVSYSAQLWLNKHRGALAAALGAAVLGGALAALRTGLPRPRRTERLR